MKLSIIIPTLNEEENIAKLIPYLKKCFSSQLHEIIVVDGGSTDQTFPISNQLGVKAIQINQQSRAIQMNKGTEIATGDLFYFVHADTKPPETFQQDIIESCKEGYQFGCFRFRFDSRNPLLKVNSFFTRYDKMWCRGGDQSLYVTRDLFEELGGYDESCLIMEDFDFIKRGKEKTKLKIIPKDVLVSARKYEENSYLKVQIANLIAFKMFSKGVAHDQILTTYKRMLDHRYK